MSSVSRPANSATLYREEKQYLTTLSVRQVSRLSDIVSSEQLLLLFTTLLTKLKTKELRGDVEALSQTIFDYLSKFHDDPHLSAFIESFNEVTFGSSAIVYAAHNSNSPIPLFAVKKQKPLLMGKDSFIHEAYVGTRIINRLRNYTPGFIHTYGLFHCTNAPIKQFCHGNNRDTDFMFLEHIPDNRTLFDYLTEDDLDEEDLAKLLLQVQSALNIAYKKYGFTHYDLHEGNVLVQRLEKAVEIPIYHRDDIHWLQTNLLFRIIDYGTATVTVDDEQHWFETKFIETRSYPCPFADFVPLYVNIYRLIVGRDVHHPLLEILSNIYAHSDRDLSDDEEFHGTKGYEIAKNGYLVTTEKYRHFTCDDILDWIMMELPTVDLWIAPEDVTNPAVCDVVMSHPCRTLEELEDLFLRQTQTSEISTVSQETEAITGNTSDIL